MTHPAFVVVSGLPGSGKSTVARALAPRLGLPILDKDEILERLFDRRGIGDAAWRRQLSRESDALLMTAAVRSPGAVIASFWHMPGMSPDSGTPTDWLARLSPTLVEIHCVCPAQVAVDRFVRRVRHPGHGDEARTPAEIRHSIEALGSPGPIDPGEAVVLDTTAPIEMTSLLQKLHAAFARSAARLAAGDA